MIQAKRSFASFSVDDVDRAKDFYGRVLGLNATVGEMGMLEIRFGDGDGDGGVLVYPKPNHQPATFTVLNFVVDDLEATVDDLTGQGVKFEHYDMPEIKTDSKGISRDDSGQGPSAIAWFTDPAGNIVSLIQQ